MLATIDTDLDLSLDFAAQLPCEGLDHSRGLHGHQVDAPGAFLLVAPCCGGRLVLCAPRVGYMRTSGLIWCTGCSTERVIEGYLFVPLDGDRP